MATLVLQVAGQALGSAIGGPAGGIIGRAAGAVAGSLIDQSLLSAGGSKAQRREGPRLKDLDGVTSSEGAPIPRVYGRARLGGQLIWATRFEEVVSVRREGGSRGGKSRSTAASQPATVTTVYSYFANAAIALCEGEIAFVRRVWADGKPVDLTGITMRVYRGSESQQPDPLIAAKQGGPAPAYRGTAYVVFERLPLEPYGNRLPQFSFEVVRPVHGLASQLRSVALIPGSGEFVYSPAPVSRDFGSGATQSENRHVLTHVSDWTASIDALQALCPDLQSVALVVTWFGDDLRAGQCRIEPRVDLAGKITSGAPWRVAGLERAGAALTSQINGRAAFGGTPSDDSVVAAIRDLRARGLKVTFYPFVMMDIPAGNTKPDPWTGAASQPAYPWRGRITCDPAPGRPGTTDATPAAAAQIAALFGLAQSGHFSAAGEAVIYSGPAEWTLRRQVLHYAQLCAIAGGVDAFVIGSEFVQVTRVRQSPGVYPAASQLIALASDVRTLLGPGPLVTYAADWTEYGAHVLGSGAEVRFPLDPLWSSPDIDAIGIDWYAPVTDWRDGSAHLDAAVSPSANDPAYIASRIMSGEAYDWYYADAAGRAAQARLAITDGLGKPWVFRQKDIKSWWLNQHRERMSGAELAAPTGWVPQSKPLWFTEFGCPAVDRGPNAPNVFPDPKSSSSELPYFSRGGRDDLAQARLLEAVIAHFDPAAGLAGIDARNPVSPVYGGRMVDPLNLYCWAYDARPFPAFPHQQSVWADGVNWATGHWLNGRIEGAPLDKLVQAIAAESGLAVEASRLEGFVDGFVIDRTMAPRAALEQLAAMFGFDCAAVSGEVRFLPRSRQAALAVADSDSVPQRGGELITLTRAETSELPREVSFGFIDSERDYRRSAVGAQISSAGSKREARAEMAIALRRPLAQQLADAALRDLWARRGSASGQLRPGLIQLEAGDFITLPAGGGAQLFMITRLTAGASLRFEARAVEPSVYEFAPAPAALADAPPPPVPGAPAYHLLDLPPDGAEPPALQHIAAAADPWPGGLVLWRSADGASYEPHLSIGAPALIGKTLTALAAGPVWRWDRVNALDVKLSGGALSSLGPLRALAGESLIAVKGADGLWEVIGFAEAELLAPRTWRLKSLLRGLGGQEHLAGRSVAPGAAVTVLDRSVLAMATGLSDLGRFWLYKLAPQGVDVADSNAVSFTSAAGPLALKPLAPVHAKARRGPGGVTLSWIRRSRREADSWEPAEIPLGEDSERYELEILSGAVVKRTLSAAAQSILYSTADELADFGAPQTQVSLRVYQISGAAGRGHALSAVVPAA